MKNNKIYNVVFPIWFLLLFPLAWLIVMPVNFLIDSIVICLALKFLKTDDILQRYKEVIVRVFLFGFLADFIGSVFLLAFTILVGRLEENVKFFKWISDNVIKYIMTNPLENIYAFIIVTITILLAGICIYYFNLKNSFAKMEIDEKDKKKLALYVAIFTAPYFFYVPISLLKNYGY